MQVVPHPNQGKGDALAASPNAIRSNQPLATRSTLPATVSAAVEAAIATWQGKPGGLLPLLHAIQDAIGYVPPESVEAIALAQGLSRAEVHGVLTYYHHFRTAAPGRHVLQVCRAESCKACGSDALLAMAKQVLRCEEHETSADGAVTLEPVFCLGLCAASPAVQLDDRVHARMSEVKLRQLLRSVEGA